MRTIIRYNDFDIVNLPYMKYRKLEQLTLMYLYLFGTMNWGEQNTEADA
jgi:hypothetical protein